MAELVRHEVNGLHFQIGDAEDLARQLSRLLEQPDLLRILTEGIPSIKSGEEEMEELLDTYQSLQLRVP